MNRSSKKTLLCAAMLALAVCGAAGKGPEQRSQPDLTDRKIRLMAEALQAQEAGDFQSAKTKLETLLQFGPNDAQVLRLLQEVNAGLQRKAHPLPPPQPVATENPVPAAEISLKPSVAADPENSRPETTAVAQVMPAASAIERQAVPAAAAQSEPPIDAATLAEREAARQHNLMAAAKSKLVHGQSLASEGRFQEALADFAEASQMLPRNRMTEPLRLEIEAVSNDTRHRQRYSAYGNENTLPRLTIRQRQVGEISAASPTGSDEPISVEIHVFKMSPGIFADLLAAWAQLSRDQRTSTPGNRMLLDRNGREVFLRRASPLPTGRQLTLYWSLIGASLREGNALGLASHEGIVGVSGRIVPTVLMKALVRLEDCELLAAPQVQVHKGSQTILSLSTDELNNGQNGRVGDIDTSPKSGIEIKVTPVEVDSSSQLEFVVNPSVVQYEGKALSSTTSPVYSSHETSTHVSLQPGATAIIGGLVMQEGRAVAGQETPSQRFPFVGRILRERAEAGRTKELVILLTRN